MYLVMSVDLILSYVVCRLNNNNFYLGSYPEGSLYGII